MCGEVNEMPNPVINKIVSVKKGFQAQTIIVTT